MTKPATHAAPGGSQHGCDRSMPPVSSLMPGLQPCPCKAAGDLVQLLPPSQVPALWPLSAPGTLVKLSLLCPEHHVSAFRSHQITSDPLQGVSDGLSNETHATSVTSRVTSQGCHSQDKCLPVPSTLKRLRVPSTLYHPLFHTAGQQPSMDPDMAYYRTLL